MKKNLGKLVAVIENRRRKIRVYERGTVTIRRGQKPVVDIRGS